MITIGTKLQRDVLLKSDLSKIHEIYDKWAQIAKVAYKSEKCTVFDVTGCCLHFVRKKKSTCSKNLEDLENVPRNIAEYVTEISKKMSCPEVDF